jgi:hypothetical protein
MALTGPKRPSTRNCRYVKGRHREAANDPDAEFLGGSNRGECFSRESKWPSNRRTTAKRRVPKVQIPLLSDGFSLCASNSGIPLPSGSLTATFVGISRPASFAARSATRIPTSIARGLPFRMLG